MSPIPELSCSCNSATTKTSRDEANGNFHKPYSRTEGADYLISKLNDKDNSTSPADNSQSVSTLVAPAVTMSFGSWELVNYFLQIDEVCFR